jgi:hypothetical protein
MPTAAASGSGEPPEESDYCGKETLPRSGLLEQAVAADRDRASRARRRRGVAIVRLRRA